MNVRATRSAPGLDLATTADGSGEERRDRGLLAQVSAAALPRVLGHIARLGQHDADLVGLRVGPGDLVEVGRDDPVLSEVVAVAGNRATVLPFGSFRGHKIGDPARTTGRRLQLAVGDQLLGRVVDGLGQPLDHGPALSSEATVTIDNEPPPALARPPVEQPLPSGVRVIDSLLTCGRGQRVAIMAGSGVGKSSLLSMLIRGSTADCNVLCLVGERGREVRELLQNDLGPEGLRSSVVVVATSDQPALVRRNAAYVATRIAEDFRDRGLHVNLLMDSVTRFAAAQREIGLAAGEIPTTRGYPPSALALLPGLLERAGTAAAGSITGFYTVLIDGDDVNDPIGDAVRSIVDGHLVLSRELANAGFFPSIDVLRSTSRVAPAVTTPDQQQLAARARRLLAVHDQARDLIEIGAYRAGADQELDEAVALAPLLDQLRRQDRSELTTMDEAWETLAGAILPPEPTASPMIGTGP